MGLHDGGRPLAVSVPSAAIRWDSERYHQDDCFYGGKTVGNSWAIRQSQLAQTANPLHQALQPLLQLQVHAGDQKQQPPYRQPHGLLPLVSTPDLGNGVPLLPGILLHFQLLNQQVPTAILLLPGRN